MVQAQEVDARGGVGRGVRRVLARVAALVFVALVVVALRYGHWVIFQHRVAVVEAGEILQSARVPPSELAALVEKHDVRAVIDLCRGDEGVELIAREREALAALNVEHVHLPTSHDPSAESVEAFLAECERLRGGEGTVLVHCHHGEGRSVSFSALYRVHFMGYSPADAGASVVRLPRDLQWLRCIHPRLGGYDVDGCKARTLQVHAERVFAAKGAHADLDAAEAVESVDT